MTILFFGGFASNTAQLLYIQKELEAHFNMPIKTYSLRYALTHANEIAKLSKGSVVITHSAGVLAALECKPRSLWVIAPPRITTQPYSLLGRSAKKTMILWGKAFSSKPRLNRVAKYHAYATKEVLFNLGFYIRLLQYVALFDLLVAIERISKTTPVYVAHMTHDSLFSEEINHSATGARHVVVEGEHDEILLYPAKVAQAANISVTIE